MSSDIRAGDIYTAETTRLHAYQQVSLPALNSPQRCVEGTEDGLALNNRQ